MKLSTCVASRILTPFVASLTLLSLIPTELPAAEPTELSAAEPTELFQRRFIVNDDGEVLLPKAGGSWDAYLGERFADTRSTQVTTYFLNVGATDRGPGIVDSLQSTMAYWADGKEAPERYDVATRKYIEAAHDAGIEIFASIRINDIHDAVLPGAAQLTYPLKAAHPEFLLGSEESLRVGRSAYPPKSIMSWFWSGLDWGQEEVRQHFFDFISMYCEKYAFDGLELDFARHPLFFRLGEETENRRVMTEFVERVRNALTEIGTARGDSYLLAVRVPDSPTFAGHAGLDVERWLSEGYVDLLIVGAGYMPYSSRAKEFIDLAHSHSVPAYPCLNHFRGPVQMHSIASNFWALGGDGFYLFNYAGVTGQEINPGYGVSHAISLDRVGDPERLRWLDKVFAPDSGSAVPYIGHTNARGQLPVQLVDGTPVELVIGDDLDFASKARRVKTMRLEVGVQDVPAGESIRLRVNGDSVPAEKVERSDDGSFAIEFPTELAVQGLNRLEVLPGTGSSGSLSASVVSMRLVVEYRPQYSFEDIVIPAASASEPRRAFSAFHGLEYIDKGATAWTKNRQCVACHTNASYMVTRPALTPSAGEPPREMRDFYVAELGKYQKMKRDKLRSGIRPTQVAYVAAGLAEWDAHVSRVLSVDTNSALDLMFKVQGDKGDWANTTCWPPFESSNYQSTTVAALAAATAPGWLKKAEQNETLKAGVEKMKSYLRATPPPHDYGKLLLLWTATRIPDVLESDAKKQEIVDMIWSHQQVDGGWSIRSFSDPDNWGKGSRADKLRAEPEFTAPASDGHQTGLCVMVLRDAGVPAQDPRIQKAVVWLLSNQRESGRWWTRSLNTDSYHFITFSGTCYPLVALAKCDVLPNLAQPEPAN